ncbi:MAG: urate hydroxylase PuuD [Burkholderiaceae bacterium]
MDPYVLEWLNLLGRWVHLITGIAWIGASFYFVWLDAHLHAPRDREEGERLGLAGEVWSVHGGGFYRAQKFKVAPAELPEPLHWFKWEAYSTWLSGMFMLVLIYWVGARVYLVDPAVADLSPGTAVAIAAAFLVGGWLVYDALCRSPLGTNEPVLAGVLLLGCTAAAWGMCQLFSGRGAYIHFGAMLGTIMAANVFFVIIPGQKALVAAKREGRAPDPIHGLRGKQRSVHNTYFTLPVIFTMISNHYASLTNHPHAWIALIGVAVAGATIRLYFVQRHRGEAKPVLVAVGVASLAGVFALAMPRSATPTAGAAPVGLAQVLPVIEQRCAGCHAERPTYPGFASPPKNVVLDSPDAIVRQAQTIHQQTVITKAMPIGNLTQIAEAERATIDAWFRAGAPR